MLENATNLTSQMGGTAIGFFSKPYAEPILIAVLIGATIMIFAGDYLFNRRGKHIERIQQEYGKLLRPEAVKLGYENGVLKYSLQFDFDWEDFISEVKKQKKYRKYKIDALYEKIENAANDYNELVENVHERKKEIANIIRKEAHDFIIWNGEVDKPSEDYIDIGYIPHTIANINEGIKLYIVKVKDGRYALQGPATFAKTTSKDKIKKLKELVEKRATDIEFKNAIKKRDGTDDDIKQALEEYNDKLAEIIRDLRMYPRGGLFR